jgi:hypothetical protein
VADDRSEFDRFQELTPAPVQTLEGEGSQC